MKDGRDGGGPKVAAGEAVGREAAGPRALRAVRRTGPMLWAALLLAAACGDAGRSGSAAVDGGVSTPGEGSPVVGGTAVVGVPSDATTVLPPLARTALDSELGSLLFPGLNRGEWEDGRLRFRQGDSLALADRWRFSADSTVLTYHLAAGRRWSDGTSITASDVVFTYRLLADSAAALPLSYVTARLDSVRALGDTAVAFHFARRYPGMLFDTGVGVLPRHVFEGTSPDAFDGVIRAGLDAATGTLVSAGPFALADWRRGERLVLVRNPLAPVAPQLDTLVVRLLPEETTRLAELRAGGLELTPVASFRQARRLEEGGDARLLAIPRRAYDYVAWNPGGHPAFADVRVRRALSLAIDREEILAVLGMEGHAEPARGPYGPLFPELTAALPPPVHDPVGARRRLEEAGWTSPPGEGVRTKGGRELAFELAVPAGSDRREAAAELLSAQLAEVSVRAEPRMQEFNSLFGRVRAADYEAALLGWQVGLDPDISPFFGRPSAPLNLVGHDDPIVRAAMDSALASATAAAALPHWRRAAVFIVEDHPYAFLWYFDSLFAVAPRLRGVEVGVTGWAAGAHRWWVRPPGGS